MKRYLALDLRVSRRRSGLSGSDLAHLLGCSQERISKLENARARIKEEELLILNLVYSEALAWPEHLLKAIVPKLKQRLSDMPIEPSQWSRAHESRLETLNSLAHRLQTLTATDNEA